MSLDMDLLQVRISLDAIKERAYEKIGKSKEFKGMEPLELAIYYNSEMYWPAHSLLGTRKTNLGSLQYLIDLYVETRSTEFQKEFRGYLEGSVARYGAADEAYGEEQSIREIARRFASDISKTVGFYEKSEIKDLAEDSQHGVDEEITMKAYSAQWYYNPLGYHDDFGIIGLKERVNAEKIRVAKKMVWKSQGSERKR